MSNFYTYSRFYFSSFFSIFDLLDAFIHFFVPKYLMTIYKPIHKMLKNQSSKLMNLYLIEYNFLMFQVHFQQFLQHYR